MPSFVLFRSDARPWWARSPGRLLNRPRMLSVGGFFVPECRRLACQNTSEIPWESVATTKRPPK